MFFALLLLYLIYIILYLLKINPILYGSFVTISLSIVAYIFDPITNYANGGRFVDSVRIFQEMDLFSRGILDVSDLYGATPLSGIYIYFFTIIGNYLLLPMVSTTFTYGIFFLDIYCLSIVFKVSRSVTLKAMFYFTFFVSFLGVSQNIRQPMLLSIYFFCMIYEMIIGKYKKKCFIMYIIISFFHSVGWIANIFRLLVELPYKYGLVILLTLLYFIFGMTDSIISLLAGFNIEFISSMLVKFNAYEVATNIDFNIYVTMLSLTFNIEVAILTILLIKFLKNNIQEKYIKVIKMAIYLLLFGLGSHIAYFLYNTELVGRMNDFLSVVVIIYIFILSKKEYFDLNNRQYRHLKFIFYGLIVSHLVAYFIVNMYITSTIMV